MLRPAWLLAFLDRSDRTLGVGRRRRLRPSFPQRRSLASRVGYDYTASLERHGDRTCTGWIVAVTGCALHKPHLQGWIDEYLARAGVLDALPWTDPETGTKRRPLFPTTVRKEKRLTNIPMTSKDICRMMKRRMKEAGLPPDLSPHSFRVTTITDLLDQQLPLEDVQDLAGHADPRTTRLYDRSRRQITRNIVERIWVGR